MPDCRAIFIDPITSFLGEVNENSNSEVRAALLGLMKLAEERDVTIIGVSHLNKKMDLSALHRTLGSVAFTAAPRSVWLVSAEKDANGHAGWRKVLPVKANLSTLPTAIRFRITDGRVDFDKEPFVESADTAITPAPQLESRALDEAKTFLGEILKDGPKPATEIFEMAEGEGISMGTIRRAAQPASGLVIKKKMKGSPWMWSLPANEDAHHGV